MPLQVTVIIANRPERQIKERAAAITKRNIQNATPRLGFLPTHLALQH